MVPDTTNPVGFETDIKPMFRERDRRSMEFSGAAARRGVRLHGRVGPYQQIDKRCADFAESLYQHRRAGQVNR